MITSRTSVAAFRAAGTGALLLAGCGSSGGGPSKRPATGRPASQPASSQPPAASQPSSRRAPASGGKVEIVNFSYRPKTITVAAGSKVVFTNRDQTNHTVTADDGTTFDVSNLDPGQTGTVTVAKAGVYAYHCNFHPFMHGKLNVR